MFQIRKPAITGRAVKPNGGRQSLMLSSAISAVALTTMLLPAARADAAICDSNIGKDGVFFRKVCNGVNGADAGMPSIAPGNPGETPVLDPQTASGSLSGTSGYATVQVGGNGGNGGEGGNYGDGTGDGGAGGAGGAGAIVSLVVQNGTISDSGDGSPAISAYGRGGNGGLGGGKGGGDGIGGAGGAAGGGGTIDFTLKKGANVVSLKPGTIAIDLQSSGGNGGDANQAKSTLHKVTGRNGGVGGAGGTIGTPYSPILIQGTISSQGTGIRAQTAGGNGGKGGDATGNSSAQGGDGGNGGTAGSIAVVLDVGSIKAAGPAADDENSSVGDGTNTILFSQASAGIMALSAGGQGGTGGMGAGGFGSGAGGSGGSAPGSLGSLQIVNSGGQISTSGYLAPGMLAQSQGGHGGNGAFGGGMWLARGGDAKPGGDGGDVTVAGESNYTGSNVAASIVTTGDYSPAMAGQSFGGGGGFGGRAQVVGSLASVSLGGTGGAGGNGGIVLVNNSDDDQTGGLQIKTLGKHSIAMMAQSIGGGGGYGGDAYTLSNGGGAAIAIGGSGKGGGNGGAVRIINANAVATYGVLAHAALAQSIGGGGGNGGAAYSISGSLTPTIAAAVAIGGSGGMGGDGDGVVVSNFGSLVTEGNGSIGVIAQSIGGGGGNGGSAATDMINLFPPVPDVPNYTFEATVSIGGNSGNGGNGGEVNFTNSGAIVTNGTGAWGALIQSIGGGGGNGGDADAFSLAIQTPALSSNTTIGGSGGTGGTGGNVIFRNVKGSNVETYGDDALGVVAQSIGGGGGNGGSASARQLNLLSGNGIKGVSIDLSLSIGGKGGAGGDGGTVSVVNEATTSISTGGNNSRAIFAQSVGGGGGWGGGGVAMGSGGSSARFTANIGLGGSGGSGATGGAVSVTNSGAIYTAGATSAGIFAQSVGGGGGVGGAGAGDSGNDGDVQVADYLTSRMQWNGDVVQVGNEIWDFKTQVLDEKTQIEHLKTLYQKYGELREAGKPSPFGSEAASQISVGVGAGRGGNGGGGGDGDTVTIVNNGIIVTQNVYSDGIFAQSVGGGGGDGGAAHSSSGSNSINANVAVGGAGGTGGFGRTVTIDNDGTIQTSGELSHAINAQSIGGGGGRGGATIGTSGEATELALSIGGSGGAHGNAGLVTVNSGGAITTGAPDAAGLTRGAEGAIGVLAQSIGGGGGQIALFGSTFGERGEAQSVYSGEVFPHAPVIKIGGTGGAGGSSDGVTVSITGTIDTSGNNAYGVFAQSIGGGGGVVFSPITDASFSNPDAQFGDGMMAGNGGAVSVSLGGSARITTAGDGAVGILAQSLGGGGGLIGGMSDVDVTRTASVSQKTHNGTSGGVSVQTDAGTSIATSGRRAHGIVAQSATGGGFFASSDGNGFAAATESCNDDGSACGAPATVSLTLNGAVSVHGADSYGVFAQNRSRFGSTISIEVDTSGTITSDDQSAGAIFIDNPGGTSTVTNYNYIVAEGAAPIAVNGTAATIENHYYIAGDLLTTSGSHVVNNYAGGTILPSTRIVASEFNNMTGAALAIGYYSNVSATLTGNLGNSGWLVFNIPAGDSQSAALTVNGTATLSNGSFLGIVGSPVLTETFAVLSAGSLEVDTLPAAGQVQFVNGGFAQVSNPTFGYTTNKDGNTITLTSRLNSASQLGVSLTPNQAATADHLSAAFAAGNAGYSRTAFQGIFEKAPTASAYKAILDQIGGHTLGAMLGSRLPLQRAFIDNMQSCPNFVAQGTATYESSCSWARFQRNWASNDYDTGFRSDVQRYQMGIQAEFADGWFLGASGGYEDQTINGANDRARLRGDLFSLGALVKRVTGNWTLSASATGTIGDFRSQRTLAISDTPARASPKTQGFALQARAAYQIPMDQWYLRPAFAVTGHYQHVNAFSETGSDFPLRVASTGNWTLAIAPSLEMGGRIKAGKTVLRPYLRGGAIYEQDNDWQHRAGLANANADIGSYTSRIKALDLSGTAAAGLDAYAGEKLTLRLEYAGEFNAQSRMHSATFKLGYRF